MATSPDIAGRRKERNQRGACRILQHRTIHGADPRNTGGGGLGPKPGHAHLDGKQMTADLHGSHSPTVTQSSHNCPHDQGIFLTATSLRSSHQWFLKGKTCQASWATAATADVSRASRPPWLEDSGHLIEVATDTHPPL